MFTRPFSDLSSSARVRPVPNEACNPCVVRVILRSREELSLRTENPEQPQSSLYCGERRGIERERGGEVGKEERCAGIGRPAATAALLVRRALPGEGFAFRALREPVLQRFWAVVDDKALVRTATSTAATTASAYPAAYQGGKFVGLKQTVPRRERK